ncbi:TPA: hypothetical protein H1009_03620 [archaeon]|nr:hypothetical protein [Candidatus Naiadarchaeales archaeon SRR2090153.bin461]
MVDLLAKFLRAYSNLPEDERGEIIVIIDNDTYTWKRAYDEALAGTELGKKIIEKLGELKII